MKLIRARYGAQSGPSPRAERCSVWPKWNIDILSQNAASRTLFFQVRAIKTGHISIICRQTGDVVCFNKGTADAKWRMKISIENFKIILQYCRFWIQNFTVTLFQLYAKDDLIHSLSDTGAFHTAKSPLQYRPFHSAKSADFAEWNGRFCSRFHSAKLCEIKNGFHSAKLCEIKIKFFSNVLAVCCYIIIAAVSDPSRGSKPRNPILRPAVQCTEPEPHCEAQVVSGGIAALPDDPCTQPSSARPALPPRQWATRFVLVLIQVFNIAYNRPLHEGSRYW